MPAWLENRVGPYAVWQWGLILLAGIALAFAVRRFRPGAGDDGARAVAGDPSQLSPFAGTQATGGPGVTYALDTAAGTTRNGTARPTTNREWLDLASSRVIDQGMHSPAAVDSALRNYLSGRPLDAIAYAIVNDALRAVGPPPEGAPPIERDEPIPRDVGPTDDGSSLRTLSGTGYTTHTVTSIDDRAVRVSPNDDGTAQVRDLSWYGSASGVPGIIDTTADWRRVAQARGTTIEDTGTALLIVQGSFGAVSGAMRTRIKRVADRHIAGQ